MREPLAKLETIIGSLYEGYINSSKCISLQPLIHIICMAQALICGLQYTIASPRPQLRGFGVENGQTIIGSLYESCTIYSDWN